MLSASVCARFGLVFTDMKDYVCLKKKEARSYSIKCTPVFKVPLKIIHTYIVSEQSEVTLLTNYT